ncbi:PLP-dependent aminotransferase family protein [Terrisporobacter mayombei]|uniref:2-aminoadipate transaminase n=1 Tax=Terrisporobacter mayombei TaxID=1541 RepID=A0ABY9Q3X5_9FIRM|nr:PLP-dependent aminotransferase family protein [Terrisporobacter mayombei]MCC3867677.1 PLP-dependent aminotransferase family protein [Terrisporobacter mayombei]WMT81939.1 2-aminoadipate transaminase [Terrisporobacter mayombei]
MDKYKLELDDNNSKYIQIYNHIKEMIVGEEIKEHEKLPPIRKLADFISVNNATIVKVYELLEKEGYVYKIIGSGTFVSSIKVNKEVNLENYKDMIHFDSGNPSKDVFPLDNFKSAINMALENDGASIFEYDEGKGSEELREELSTYLKKKRINTNKDNIQIISGAQQGIDIVCKGLINYSDVVFVEEPTYNGALEVFKSRGAKIITIPMLDDGIDIGILKLKLEKIKPKLIYVMPNFQNPSGISYSEYKKKKLIELSEEYDFYILEDDFISDFIFDSKDNRPLKSYDMKNRVIYIKSFSKILMPGLRIGIVDIPRELQKKILWAKYSSDISTPGLIQKSMYYYMKYFNWEEYLKNIDKVYTKKYRKTKILLEEKLGDKLKIYKSQGGLNFFIELPRGYSSQIFYNFMLEKGVCITPGTYFFDNIMDDRFFRINIANEAIEDIEKGITIIENNLEEFITSYKNGEAIRSNKIFY